ncbi:Gfo/Idh/MocA family protein [Pelagibacterium montanilacus]|uniref:Gfo/Idh/MocA family protein n=1 Tax=Pelagibacterium montanilacus TaxID=2185280 RepID=UPI000F8F6173|nr:Gfo/Idh/MocA family oxidoreductase [Pelagibacterium montanilacus]
MGLRVAIIGAGWMGATHGAAIAANGDEVVLVIDADSEQAKALAAKHGARAGTELSMTQGLDAAVIATPSFQHLEQATALARMGVDVLVEKPHRLPNQSSDGLIGAIEAGGARVLVGMTTRFHEGIMALAEALRTRELGAILSYADSYFFELAPDTLAPWYFDPRLSGGGVVTTNGVHLIDRCAWLLGEDMRVEAAEGLVPLHPGHRVEDHAELRLRGRTSGTPVTLSLLWAPYPCPEPELRVVGTHGIARIGLSRWVIETAEVARGGTIERPDDAFVRQWADFRACLANGGVGGNVPDVLTLESTLELISQIYTIAQGAQAQ